MASVGKNKPLGQIKKYFVKYRDEFLHQYPREYLEWIETEASEIIFIKEKNLYLKVPRKWEGLLNSAVMKEVKVFIEEKKLVIDFGNER